MLPLHQRQKKTRLTFLMASYTALEAERSQDHQYSRHLALRRDVRAFLSRTAIGADEDGLDGDMSTISHFVGFRVRPLSAAKACTVSICSCKVARELLMVRMSSA